MPHDRLESVLAEELERLDAVGTRKSRESVIQAVIAPANGKGPRYLLQHAGDQPFLRMNSNSYLGLSFLSEVQQAEEQAIRRFGTGPGAVRFISGTWAPHVELESRLADFHRRQAAMIFSSAYATVMGLLPALITPQTGVISDALNHNCIINALRLARPKERLIYAHNDLDDLEAQLDRCARTCRRAIIVTDGIFSMRGDHAPLAEMVQLAKRYDSRFPENALLVVDDSHGVGAIGATGRGTEEQTGCEPVDLLVATLGKAIGVNGGYVAASQTTIDYLREKSPLYIYSNPITPGEAAAAIKAVDIIDSERGLALIEQLRAMTARFDQGLTALGFETIPGPHPIVPLMVRDTKKTSALVGHLHRHGVLATGLNYPVIPQGDEEIRFQISADHTIADIDEALSVLADFPNN